MSYLDKQVLDELIEILGEEDLFSITESFLDQLEVQLSELEQFMRGASLPDTARIAHSLKGGAGNLGASALSSAAANLEQHAKASDQEMAAKVFAELVELARNTVSELQAGGYVKSGG